MNSVTLYNFESGVIVDSYNSNMGQRPEDSDLINHRAKKPIWYGSLDGEGVRLKDTDVVIPYLYNDEHHGYVSSITSNSQGVWEQYPSITITFELPVNLTRGIVVWQHTVRDYTGILRCTLYDENNRVIAEEDGYNAIDNGSSKMPIDIVGNKVKKLTIKPTSDSLTAIPFSFLKIDGVDLGSIEKIDNIVGEIDVYSEIEPSKTDVPSGSCDIAVQTTILPLVGQSFILNCDNGFTGKYTITNVSRTARDIFTIQACDDIENLGAFLTNDFELGTGYNDRKDITKNTSVTWSDNDPLEKDEIQGWMVGRGISRQELAKLSAASNMWVSAMGDNEGIHFVKPNLLPKQIPSNKIIGQAEYQNVMPYKGVIIKNNYEGSEYVTELKAPQAMNNNKGWLTVDNFMLIPNGDTIENCVNLAKNIIKHMNGNEVTATIVYDNEQLGDMVTIETPYNGNVTGFIKSIGLTIGSKSTLAEIVVKEVTD